MAKISSIEVSDSISAERTKVRSFDDDLELTDDCLLAIADNWRRESEKVRSSREPRAPKSRPSTSERRAERARRKRSRFDLADAILTFLLCVLACGILGIWIVCVERSRAPSATNASIVSSTTSGLAKPFEKTRSEPRTTQTISAAMKTAPLSPALQFTSRVLQGKPFVAFIELSPRALQSALSEPRLPSATLEASQTSATIAERSVVIEPCRISEIGIGDRLPGENPQGNDGSSELEFLLKPHCVYSLRYEKEDGTFCNIKLLRSDDWLDQVALQFRRVSDGKVLDAVDLQLLEILPFSQTQAFDVEVWLDLEELGCVGWATLVDIDDSFEYREGVGNLVTGTFEHESGEVVDLQLEGQDKLIGVTLTHPFWSVDREDFVTVEELCEGERVLLYSGETKRVAQKLPRPGPQRVYNLEVFGEHVYHVTPDGALAHNACNHAERVEGVKDLVRLDFDDGAESLFIGTHRGVHKYMKQNKLTTDFDADHIVANLINKRLGRVSHGKGVAIGLLKEIHKDAISYGGKIHRYVKKDIIKKEDVPRLLNIELADLRIQLAKRGYSQTDIDDIELVLRFLNYCIGF